MEEGVMYYVIGTDGSQYGPVDEATLRIWLAEGRVTAASLSFKTGETLWTPIKDRPEFAGTSPGAAPQPGIPPAPGPRPVNPDGPKDWLTALLLSIFLGTFGVDRFYMGQAGLGIGKLLTLGGCGVWWLIDVILIATGSAKDSRGRLLVRS
jgi:TM2 domain/GYF domain 2